MVLTENNKFMEYLFLKADADPEDGPGGLA